MKKIKIDAKPRLPCRPGPDKTSEFKRITRSSSKRLQLMPTSPDESSVCQESSNPNIETTPQSNMIINNNANNDIDLDEVNCAHPSTDMICIENSTKKKEDTDLSQQETLSPTNTIPEKHPWLNKCIIVNAREHSMQLRKKPNAFNSSLKTYKNKKIAALNLSANEPADNSLCMPIITSTISLAPVTDDDVSGHDKISALKTQSASSLKTYKNKKKSVSFSTDETAADVSDMPIITSTISLAPFANDDETGHDKINAQMMKTSSK